MEALGSRVQLEKAGHQRNVLGVCMGGGGLDFAVAASSLSELPFCLEGGGATVCSYHSVWPLKLTTMKPAGQD